MRNNLIELSLSPDSRGISGGYRNVAFAAETTRAGRRISTAGRCSFRLPQEITARAAVYALGGSPRLDVIATEFLSGERLVFICRSAGGPRNLPPDAWKAPAVSPSISPRLSQRPMGARFRSAPVIT